MKYVMGIDSGGTKTVCLVASEDGEILAKGISGAGAFVDINTMAKRSIAEAIHRILSLLDKDIAFEAVYVSLGGLNTGEVETIVNELVKSKKVIVKRESSGEIIFTCAPYWGFNIVVMSGTGSIAFGTSHTGIRKIVGGWGHIIDDRGSGYAIGRDALRAVADFLDGQAEATGLLSLVCTANVFNNEMLAPKDLASRTPHSLSYEERLCIKEMIKKSLPQLDRQKIAQLAPLVYKAAQNGDRQALQIIRKAAKDLALLANTLIRELHMEDEEPVVTGIGGVFKIGDMLWGPFCQEIKKVASAAKTGTTDFALVLGTALCALDKGGISLDNKIF